MVDNDDTAIAAARSGGVGAVLLALLALLYEGSVVGAAEVGSTATADARRLADTARVASVDMASVAVRGSSLGAVLLTFLGFLYEGSAARAAVDGPTTTAAKRRPRDTAMVGSEDDERRLMDTAMANSGDMTRTAVSGGGLGARLMLLHAFFREGSATRAMLGSWAVTADERRVMGTAVIGSDDMLRVLQLVTAASARCSCAKPARPGRQCTCPPRLPTSAASWASPDECRGSQWRRWSRVPGAPRATARGAMRPGKQLACPP